MSWAQRRNESVGKRALRFYPGGSAGWGAHGMTEGKRKWGFALLTPERRKEIASKGGRAAQKRGRAHRFDSEDAREAGRKGGAKVSQDRAHMAEIGAKGGRVRRRDRAAHDDAKEEEE